MYVYRWSKTVMGYGAEGQGYVTLELIYHMATREDLLYLIKNPRKKLRKAPAKDWIMLEVVSHKVCRESLECRDSLESLYGVYGV